MQGNVMKDHLEGTRDKAQRQGVQFMDVRPSNEVYKREDRMNLTGLSPLMASRSEAAGRIRNQ
jgi:hypothetical protein